jgi:signal transduction histidine kinase/CheY-like chemotaxis protein
MEDLRILIVEDNPNNASYLSNQLNKLGYQRIDFATNSKEAVILTENGSCPDLIFMDIFLRGDKNGIDTALEIYRKAKIPTVFLSTPENLFMLNEARFIKNPTFLSKPFEIGELQKSIIHLQDETIRKTPEYGEAERLNQLTKYEILDTPREGNFDRITTLAAKLLNVPIALVSIVDEDRIWFKSKYGFKEKEIPKDRELFASSFISPEFYHYNKQNDTTALINPILAYDSGFEFYAASPLLTADGHALGMLCVLDKKPRTITEKDKLILDDLARIIMDEMEMRLAYRQAYKKQREFLNIAVHDLKNPLAAILGFSNLIQKKNDVKVNAEYNGYIKKSADSMLQIVEGLLKNSLMELDQVQLQCIPVHFSELVDSVIAGNKTQAARKSQKLTLSMEGDPIVRVDSLKLGEAMDNVVSNAIKYSAKGTEIQIIIRKASDKILFKVKDDGPGLTDDERKKVFEKFSHLSAQPTGGETSTGLGLSITKKLVELHGGKISVESEGREKGCTFIIEIPLATEKEQKQLELQAQMNG